MDVSHANKDIYILVVVVYCQQWDLILFARNIPVYIVLNVKEDISLRTMYARLLMKIVCSFLLSSFFCFSL